MREGEIWTVYNAERESIGCLSQKGRKPGLDLGSVFVSIE